MLLGDHPLRLRKFPHLDQVLGSLKKLSSVSDLHKNDAIGRSLLELIRKEAEPCFLLAAVLDFLERLDKEKIVEHYTFASFELWLNQTSDLSAEENLRIRGKIVGKWVERSAYQVFFPVGMGKTYPGTHFVTAHKSPDLDTTIASFWGWVDAFGARLGDSLHVWNLPGGPPSSQIEVQWIFSDLFGAAVFSHLPKTRNALNLTANDLMSKAKMVLKKRESSMLGAEVERDSGAIVVIDDQGFYLGDWRSVDVEEVRQVIVLFNLCLRWFENHLQLHLISLFAKKDLAFDLVKLHLSQLFSMKLEDCEPAKEFSFKQRKEVSQFIFTLLEMREGLSVSFEVLGLKLAQMASIPFHGLDLLFRVMGKLFDSKGSLIEDRSGIFSFLEVTIGKLHEAILAIRSRLEKLDIGMLMKTKIFGHHPTFVTDRSDVEEIRQKMGAHVSLTVTSADHGNMLPVGVIRAEELRKPVLGTVSLRDFCNREEMSIPPYLDVISVIDHHKSQLQTISPPFAVIADAQSSNTLVARQAFEINDQYALGLQTAEAIEQQIEEENRFKTPSSNRILQRLLAKRNRWLNKTDRFIDPEREFVEYLHFLYAILDDTDLLSKISVLDLECVVSLLNRMKTLSLGKEVEIVSIDDIPRDKHFLKRAAERILQNEDMYSLYSKVYAHREKEVAESISLAALGKPSHFFADTKAQNGCCRIGQTKMFASNVSLFTKHASSIQRGWLDEANRIHKEKPEIDLHIHMISTIVSAQEVYQGTSGNYEHKDELWLWIPKEDVAIEHLKRFLTSFQSSPGLKNNSMEAEFIGFQAKEYELIFKESFLHIPSRIVEKGPSFAILRYKAGSLNSRKAMISPFLPSL